MKLDELSRIQKPVVMEKPACSCCHAFAPECLVPMGDGALAACWQCAHQIVEHEVPVDEAWRTRCKCSASEIYPAKSGMLKDTRWEAMS